MNCESKLGIKLTHDANRELALRSWLAAGAPPTKNLADLCEETGKRLRLTGLTVDQFAPYSSVIHPEAPGTYVYWTKASGIRLYTFPAEQLRSKIWVGCAAQRCGETGRMITHTFGHSPEFDDRPETQMLAERGYKQVVYTPLHSNYTFNNSVAAYGTKQDTGFSEEEVHSLRLLQGQLARVVEVLVLHESTVQILSTYVGRNAGARVLSGNILRGHTEAIPAVVLFADLRGFTTLSNTRSASEVIEILNNFFDAAESAISDNGGEVLKFLGDGLLAIFPTPDDVNAQLAAPMNAISAIEETRLALKDRPGTIIEFRAALDVGDIYYGNIGSKSRLDFTAIGATVNRAARLLSVADSLGAEVVCSEALHRLLPNRAIALGDHAFKGFDSPQPVYRIDF